MRLPYGPDSSPVTAFNFQEDVTQHNKYLWGNAAYALALRLTTAFAQHGWLVHGDLRARGWRSGAGTPCPHLPRPTLAALP